MAERVKIVSRSGRIALVDARVARHLVARRTHTYAPEEAPEPAKPARKKRTYKRRDMQAEG